MYEVILKNRLILNIKTIPLHSFFRKIKLLHTYYGSRNHY